jgi:hypothetical protein
MYPLYHSSAINALFIRVFRVLSSPYLAISNISPKLHKGKWVYYVKNKDLKTMMENEVVAKQEVDKLRNLVVIANDREEVVTAYYATKQKQKKVLRL